MLVTRVIGAKIWRRPKTSTTRPTTRGCRTSDRSTTMTSRTLPTWSPWGSNTGRPARRAANTRTGVVLIPPPRRGAEARRFVGCGPRGDPIFGRDSLSHAAQHEHGWRVAAMGRLPGIVRRRSANKEFAGGQAGRHSGRGAWYPPRPATSQAPHPAALGAEHHAPRGRRAARCLRRGRLRHGRRGVQARPRDRGDAGHLLRLQRGLRLDQHLQEPAQGAPALPARRCAVAQRRRGLRPAGAAADPGAHRGRAQLRLRQHRVGGRGRGEVHPRRRRLHQGAVQAGRRWAGRGSRDQLHLG